MPRKKVSPDVQERILVKSRRRCALCFGLHYSLDVKAGQIAHIDQDSSNSSLDNLVYLCLIHHDEYDSRKSQSKGITERELRFYRDELHKVIDQANENFWIIGGKSDKRDSEWKREKLSIEVYDRRIQIYRSTKDFIISVLSGAELDYSDIFSFSKVTDEAIFLFDFDISNYISELGKRAIQLIYANQVISNPDLEPYAHQSYIKNHTEIMLWFNDQIDASRDIFYKWLSL